MHPALLIAVIEERQREIARRNRHAWKRPPIAAKAAETSRLGAVRDKLSSRRGLLLRRARRV